MSSDEDKSDDMSTFLCYWTHQYNIKKSALTALLKKLKSNGFPNLPSDSRTLLRTPTQRNMSIISNGHYCHIGLAKAINYYVQNLKTIPEEITLDFNIDGVPLSRSSNKCFWLILVQVFAPNCPRKVFAVGAFYVCEKPGNFCEFLKPSIDEAKLIMNDYKFKEKKLPVKIRCIVCDAPARNSCLGTKSFTGYFGCGRCTQEGNYLHTVCLGVVKKLVGMWIYGDLDARLCKRDVLTISSRLETVSSTQPSEFQRKCRPLKEYSNFMGSEFRNLLLYILPVVTKGIIPVQPYNNLLVLHCAI